MIASEVVSKIRRLLAEDELSHRQIARCVGVSRRVVDYMADGLRTDREADWPEPAGPAQRCPECGGMVYMPCRLCELRRMAAGMHTGPPADADEDPVRLELKPDHQHRYEEVCRRRLAEQASPLVLRGGRPSLFAQRDL
jgi:hypothetical protein